MTVFLSYQYNSFCFFVYFDGKFCLSGIQISKKSAFRQQTAQQIIFLFLGFLRLEFCFVLSMRTKQNSFFLSKYFLFLFPYFPGSFHFLFYYFRFYIGSIFICVICRFPSFFLFQKRKKKVVFPSFFILHPIFDLKMPQIRINPSWFFHRPPLCTHRL